MVGWHHRLHGHESEQILGDSEGQGSLACFRPWGFKESYMTWQLYHSKTAARIQPWKDTEGWDYMRRKQLEQRD